MIAFVTGSTGFIGSHLCQFLKKQGVEVYGTMRKNKGAIKSVKYIHIDLLNKEKVEKIIKTIKPRYIFHLAAQNLVSPSWKNPEETLKFNIFSTLYLLDAIANTKIKTRMVIFGSSSEYAPDTDKIKEIDPLYPSSPYALSKIVQDHLGQLYFTSKKIDIVRIRPFFVIGPIKTHDAVSDFCHQIIGAEKGKKNKIIVGNLKSIRDFVDIEDALKAIFLIVQKGVSGEVYNISSGNGTKLKEILQKLLSLSDKRFDIVINRNLYRPIDEPIKIGDNTKLKNLGWKQSVSLDESLAKILKFWSSKL